MEQSATMLAQPEGADAARLLPIPIDSLDFRAHDLDMYIWHRDQRPALYRGSGTEFTAEDLERLTAQDVRFLHIPAKQHTVYRQALSERLGRQFSDPQASRQERARVVRAACTRMIEEVLLLPDQPEPIAGVSELARQFQAWSERDPETFAYMLEMSDHDFYTTTHMVNVGVGCGLLGARLKPDDTDFVTTLYQGGLLHDLGKRDVPTEVLNKEGALTTEEWALVRQHPEVGYAELVRCGGVPAAVLEMTRDHHERLDGSGYPGNKTADQLSLAARICSVVDVFDALTAARPYRGPMPPANALRLMEDGIGTHFDEGVFTAWRELVEELLRRDPARARPMAAAEQFQPLTAYGQGESGREDEKSSDLLTDAIPDDAETASGERNERREFERHFVTLSIQAEFERQLKRYPVSIGERFKVRTVDISRSGMQIETPWPLAINDLLIVHLVTAKGTVRWRVRVARVRSCGHAWRAGLQMLCKLDDEQAAA